MNNTTILLHNVSKWYGDIEGVRHINAKIPQGITGILGPNGCGKTTLLQLLVGELKPSEGKVLIWNQNPWNNPNIKQKIGFCPDGDGFYQHLTGKEFLLLLGKLNKLPQNLLLQKIKELTQQLHLPNLHHPISTYSRGTRQKLKLAQAILAQPQLLILDEPLRGVDPTSRQNILETLQNLAKQNTTILFSSHVLYEIENLAENILLLWNGRLQAFGKIQNIWQWLTQTHNKVKVETNQPRKLAQKLIQKHYIQQVELPTPKEAIFHLTNTQNFFQDLAQTALKYNIEIQSIHSREESLEEIFSILQQKSPH